MKNFSKRIEKLTNFGKISRDDFLSKGFRKLTRQELSGWDADLIFDAGKGCFILYGQYETEPSDINVITDLGDYYIADIDMDILNKIIEVIKSHDLNKIDEVLKRLNTKVIVFDNDGKEVFNSIKSKTTNFGRDKLDDIYDSILLPISRLEGKNLPEQFKKDLANDVIFDILNKLQLKFDDNKVRDIIRDLK